MAFINERVFAIGGNKRCLCLQNNELLRRLNIGNNWNTLRIGLLWSINTSGGAQDQFIPFAVGMTSGMNGFSVNSTPHFVGSAIVPNLTGGVGQWTYNANSGLPYYTASGGAMIRKVGTFASGITEAHASNVNVFVASSDGTVQRRSWAYFDIQRGYLLNTYSTATSAIGVDYTYNDFLEGCEQPGAPTIRGTLAQSSTQQSIVGTESAGILDTINIWYSSYVFPIEIYAIAVYRMI